MIDKKKAFVFAILSIFVIVVTSALEPASAETIHNKNYDLDVIATYKNGTQLVTITTHPERIHDGTQYKDYLLFENSSIIRLETANAGSIVFSKTSCTYDLYKKGMVGATFPTVKNIGWSVKGKLATDVIWSNLNGINGAVCNVAVQSTEETVTITGTKQTGSGTFQIVLHYEPGKGIKETMRAYNNNLAWNNHHIGFVESFEVPRMVTFGESEYDLANLNGVEFDRNWIQNNQAKILKFTDSLYYDVGIGFEHLEKIKIIWDGSNAKIEMYYLYTNSIVPYQQWVEVDPTFGYSTGSWYGVWIATASVVDCAGITAYNANNSGLIAYTSGGADDCYVTSSEWDVSTIPTTLLSVTDTKLRIDNGGSSSARNCDIMPIASQPSVTALATRWTDIHDGVAYVSNNAFCASDQTDTIIDLGTSADASILAARQASQNWWAAGFKYNNEVRDGVTHQNTLATPELQVTYLTSFNPEAVDDLALELVSSTSVDATWSAPTLPAGSITKYTINYTTPFGSPSTILNNNTGTGTTYTVTGLTGGANYSFRVGVQTTAGYNMSGNIANITMSFVPANFTIGFLDISDSNPEFIGIRFEETDINSTATTLKVIYDEDYDMSCTFSYRLSQTSDTYTNITESVFDSERNYTDFTFLNPNRDIINARCWDTASNDTGTYVISQSSFVLLEMINNFRNGTYGTQGQFGALDFITLVVVIISMIGFNRVSPVVGVIFCSATIFFTAWFGIITWPTIFASALALIIALAVGSARKD